MERFFGFDLGDAESAISWLGKDDQTPPKMIKVCEAESFITACATLRNGELQIGEQACYNAQAVRRSLRFKSRFLTDASSEADVKRFAAGVLGELYGSGDLVQNEDCCFYIGCPAGWNKQARETYRAIFEQVGYPPVRIISESRAAMVSACQSRHLQVGYDILSKPVLVVDIGSSTTDFAYICGGKEVEMQTAGEVSLGGGIMDELLLGECVKASKDARAIQKVFEESEAWRTYCEFAARRLKEKYFSEEEYWETHPCTETVLISYKEPLRLRLFMDQEMARKLTTGPAPRLEGRSFYSVFTESLHMVKDHITGDQPELIFLTGGVSKMPMIRTWCQNVFPDAVVIAGMQPEFSVSRGLAWSGRIDEELRQFRAELDQLNATHVVEDIVSSNIGQLYKNAVDTLVDPIIEHVAMPVFERWREGEIRRLSDTDQVLQDEIAAFLRTEEARELLIKPIAAWLRPVSDALEEYTVPICVKHHVPYTALSLNSYLAVSDIDIRIDARNMFAVEELTVLIDSIISLLVGLICGGSGIALVSSGPGGVIAGILISFLVLILGKDKMTQAMLNMDIPGPMRKMVPRHAFKSRLESMTATIKKNFYESLEKDKNDEITTRMVNEISAQIEHCLTKMAEIVEIPLG